MQKITKEQLASLEAVAKALAARASETFSKLVGLPVALKTIRTRVVEVPRLIDLPASPEELWSAVFLPVMGEVGGGGSAS